MLQSKTNVGKEKSVNQIVQKTQIKTLQVLIHREFNFLVAPV